MTKEEKKMLMYEHPSGSLKSLYIFSYFYFAQKQLNIKKPHVVYIKGKEPSLRE